MTFCSCEKEQKNEKESEKDTLNQSSIVISSNIKSANWIKDTFGCLKLRSLEIAQDLIIENELLNKSKEKFLLIFGEPNEKIISEGRLIFNYYINSYCDSANKPILNSDKSWIDFYFDSTGRLKEIPQTIGIE